MGIKEFLTGKKQQEVKYRLSDIVWAHNMYKNGADKEIEDAVNVPFIPNKDETKYRNLLTNDIVEIPIVFTRFNPIESTLCNSVGLNYNNGGCGISDCWTMIYKALNIRGVSEKIIKDCKAYGTMCAWKNKPVILVDYCKETFVTQKELIDFANSLTKARNIQNAKENADRLKKAKEDAEYERNARDF